MRYLLGIAAIVIIVGLTGCYATNPSQGSIGVIPDTVTIPLGSTQTFSPVLSGTLAGSSVTWSISGSGCSGSSCGTIDSSGNYKAPTTAPSNPSFEVIATATNDTSKSGFALVTIGAAVSISTTPAGPISVQSGQSTSVTAAVTGSTNTVVNWTATAGTITASTPNSATAATYTAPSTLPNPPTATITATSAADPTKSATITVNLALNVVVLPSSTTVGLLDLKQFNATVTGQGGSAISVTWSLSGSSCSGVGNPCGTINSTGNYTAPAAVPSSPNVTVTAAVTESGSTATGSGQATLTIVNTVSGNTGQLFGRYALFFRGYPNPSGTPTVEAGSLVFDGNGLIPIGVEDDNDGTTPHSQRAVTGTYQFDASSSRTGTITLSGGLTTTLRFALVPNSTSSVATKVYLTDFSAPAGAVGAGRMELQPSAGSFASSMLSGGYALSLRGGTHSGLSIATFASAVGRFDLNGTAGTIANGELGRGFDDTNFGDCSSQVTIASPTPAYTTFSGTIGPVDPNSGHTTLTLSHVNMGGGANINFSGASVNISITLSAYIVSPAEILLVEPDTAGYAFVGVGAQQTTNSFQNSSFSANGIYDLLVQASNGPGTGNNMWTPILIPSSVPSSGSVLGLDELEYTGVVDSQPFYGLNNPDVTVPANLLGGYYSVVQTNGLQLTKTCFQTLGLNPSLVMYLVSPSKAFVWNPNNGTGSLAISDMLGEIDLQQGGPYGAVGQAQIDGTYAFSFQGIEGTGNTATAAIAESGIVSFATTGQTGPDLINGNQQFGTVTFVMDEKDSSGHVSPVTVTGNFTMNYDLDGDDDGDSDLESFGSITFAVAPAFPVPNVFLVTSGGSTVPSLISFACTTSAVGFTGSSTCANSNIAGIAEKQ